MPKREYIFKKKYVREVMSPERKGKGKNMEIELKKEDIVLNKKVAVRKIRVPVEADIIVPDSKPDIERVLQVDAGCITGKVEIQEERVLIPLDVNFQIMYMPESGEVRGISNKVQLTDVAEVKNISKNMKASYVSEVENVSYTLLNGRKISVRAEVAVSLCVLGEKEYKMLCSAEAEGIEIKTKPVSFIKSDLCFTKEFSLKEKIVIPITTPSASEVLRVFAKVGEIDHKIINNKAIVKGECVICAVYTDKVSLEVKTKSISVPFTEIADTEGINGDMYTRVDVKAANTSFECETDGDGEIRIINAAADCYIRVCAVDTEEAQAVCDCYSVKNNIKLEKSELDLDVLICDFSEQLSIKEKLFTPDDSPEIKQIYDVMCDAYVNGVEISGSGGEIKGRVDAYLLYVTDDKETPVGMIKKEIEFSKFIPFEGDGDCVAELDASATNASFTLNAGNCAEVRCTVNLKGVVTKPLVYNVISDINEDESEHKMPEAASLTVYFVQENDTLWSIAKHYMTTVDLIKSANDLEGEALAVGRQLLIPKYR